MPGAEQRDAPRGRRQRGAPRNPPLAQGHEQEALLLPLLLVITITITIMI